MNRSLLALFAGGLVALAPLPAVAQLILSDFSDLSSQPVTFLDSWTDNGNPQFVQNSGYVSIEPVSGGSPASDGRFLVAVSLDLTQYSSLQISGREVAGNLTDSITIMFENTGGLVREYTFDAADFAGSSFFTASVDLGSPTYSDIGFDPTAVTAWGIEGNKQLTPVQDFRFDFDNVQLTPVPEPATWALLALGAGAFWRRRRRTDG